MTGACEFIVNLAQALAGDQTAERILLAPSHRVGRQWLDRVALHNGGVIGVRATTLRRLILDTADAALRLNGLRPGGKQEKVRLIGEILAALASNENGEGYFSRLPASLEMAETLLAALEELEAGKAGGAAAMARKITPPAKAAELVELSRRFRRQRKRAGIAGVADIHAAAVAAVGAGDFAPPLLIIPASLPEECSALEKEFLAAWPRDAVRMIAEDGGAVGGEAAFFSADSVANEAREVLRRIQRLGIPLDQAEVACVDAETYVPALCAAALEAFDCQPEELPVTFNAGIPVGHSRPGRLLAAWLAWLEEELPAEGLARMVEAGLLGRGWRDEVPGVSVEDVASRLRALPINGDMADYRRHLGTARSDSGLERALAWLARLLPEIVPCDRGGAPDLSDATAVLAAALRLLSLPGLDRGRLDAYARSGLAHEIGQWAEHAGWPGFDAVAWLGRLVEGFRVMGLGPLPGRLYVSDIHHGGHSGRAVTFVVGLDDGRFPGGGRQDPVLLDKERLGLSPNLVLSGRARQRREQALSRLLARLRGRVFVSHARSDGSRNRELFPAAAFSRLMEEAGGRVETVAALTPDRDSDTLNSRDDWLLVLPAEPRHGLTAASLAPWFPDLGQGGAAAAARRGPKFSEYDGHVPEAGADFAAAAVSPTDFEVLAKCPLEFFFKRVLGVRPPDRYKAAPGKWLEGRVRGSLLHDVFQEFLTLLPDGSLAGLPDSRTLLEPLLGAAVTRHRRQYPPRDEFAFRREASELREACAIFYATEETRQLSGRPLYLEVSLGGAETPATPWDRVEPLRVTFGGGAETLLRGRVDRIDRLHGGGLIIIDYKTGKSTEYSIDDPLRQGRHLQPYLYSRMLEQALAELRRPEPVVGFSYFFPMPRDEGRTLSFQRLSMEEEGREIMQALIAVLRAGAFVFTCDARDVKYSDYTALYGDIAESVAAAREKALADPVLADWARLRGLA